jgi:hypothetical protein
MVVVVESKTLEMKTTQRFYFEYGFTLSQMGKRSNKLKCSLCNGEITFMYRPMEQWKTSGNLCGRCYDKKLVEYYLPSGVSTEKNP